MPVKKKLGGDSGKLKCTQCGKPRYPRMDLCPSCYYKPSRWKWYGIHGINVVVTRSDGETEYGAEELIKAKSTSVDHALSKLRNRIQWIACIDSFESDSEREVDEWILNQSRLHPDVYVRR